MTTAALFFYLFAGMALGFSLLTVFKRNPVTSAFSLVMVFFSFAGLYALMDAHLVAALQVLVYAGAIMVLFVFVIMLLGADTPVLDLARSSLALKGLVLLVAVASTVAFMMAFRATALESAPALLQSHSPDFIAQHGGNTRVVSTLMFSEYLLPFELTSILLLAGIVGAVSVAKRKPGLLKSGGRK